MTTLNQTRQEIEARILKRANHEPVFRQGLLNDPKATIADFIGTPLPPGMTITVMEEQPGQHFLVLPATLPPLEALPLDDLELALVGGGRTMRPTGVNCGDTGYTEGRRGAEYRRGSQDSC